MEPTFHYSIMAIQSMIHKELLTALSDTPLSMGQPKILDYLLEHDGSSQKDIAVGCCIEQPTLTALLGRMESGGLVERRTKDNNRRTLYVYLTDDGRKYGNRVKEEFTRIEETAFGGISDDDMVMLERNIHQIFENLKKKRGIEK